MCFRAARHRIALAAGGHAAMPWPPHKTRAGERGVPRRPLQRITTRDGGGGGAAGRSSPASARTTLKALDDFLNSVAIAVLAGYKMTHLADPSKHAVMRSIGAGFGFTLLYFILCLFVLQVGIGIKVASTSRRRRTKRGWKLSWRTPSSARCGWIEQRLQLGGSRHVAFHTGLVVRSLRRT